MAGRRSSSGVMSPAKSGVGLAFRLVLDRPGYPIFDIWARSAILCM